MFIDFFQVQKYSAVRSHKSHFARYGGQWNRLHQRKQVVNPFLLFLFIVPNGTVK